MSPELQYFPAHFMAAQMLDLSHPEKLHPDLYLLIRDAHEFAQKVPPHDLHTWHVAVLLTTWRSLHPVSP